ncbi:MAG: cell division protein FtsQ/DivIB [Aggregatilineales bacterium]
MNVVRPPRRTPQVRPSHATLLDNDSALESDVRRGASQSLTERRQARRASKRAAALADVPAAVPRDAPRLIFISWRWVSGALTAILVGVLYLFMSQNSFYIHSIYVGYTDSQHYLSVGYVYALTGLADMHIFWANASTVKQNLEQDPQIASADVTIDWPSKVVVTITERQPALIWEQSGQRVWVDIRGRVMPLRQDKPELVRVIVEKPSQTIHLGKCENQGMDTVLGRGDCIDQNTVNGVLQFKALYPNVTEMVYDPVKGLGFHEGGNHPYTLWFGDGVDIPTKMAVYNAIIADLLARGVQPIEINVANPDAPYYNAAPSS